MPSGFTHLLLDALSIVLIDLLLAGDNALVIAMAVRSLPPQQRRIGIACGAALAVALRVGITFAAAQLLAIEFIKLAGGVLVLWIAVKILQDAEAPEAAARHPQHFLQAMWIVVFADLTMSADNILAVAGASKGRFALILFGLGLSIPLVVFASTLISLLMDRFPITVYVGAAVLGKVGGEMIVTDPFIERMLHPPDAVRYAVEAALAVAVIAVGILLRRRATS